MNNYQNSDGVFYNKFGITNQAELSLIEYEITTQKSRILKDKLCNFNNIFNFERLKSIHKYLFEDIYEWAGKVRTTPSRKRNPITSGITQFTDPLNIESEWFIVSNEIKNLIDASQLNLDEDCNSLCLIFVKANQIHPFPDGNGRSLQLFIREVGKELSIELDFSKVNNDEWNRSCAVSGVHGRLFERQHFIKMPSNLEPIKEIFKKISTKIIRDMEEYKDSEDNLSVELRNLYRCNDS